MPLLPLPPSCHAPLIAFASCHYYAFGAAAAIAAAVIFH